LGSKKEGNTEKENNGYNTPSLNAISTDQLGNRLLDRYLKTTSTAFPPPWYFTTCGCKDPYSSIQ
jgi:hypothetical protein